MSRESALIAFIEAMSTKELESLKRGIEAVLMERDIAADPKVIGLIVEDDHPPEAA